MPPQHHFTVIKLPRSAANLSESSPDNGRILQLHNSTITQVFGLSNSWRRLQRNQHGKDQQDLVLGRVPEAAQRKHYSNRGLLCRLVWTMQSHRTYIRATGHVACSARQNGIRQSERR
jgi:hypothetical protein